MIRVTKYLPAFSVLKEFCPHEMKYFLFYHYNLFIRFKATRLLPTMATAFCLTINV
jgi:hypothetical protein